MSQILELIDTIDPYRHFGELYEDYLKGQNKAFTGVGSRACDPNSKKYKPHDDEETTRLLMTQGASELERRGFILRSGGAEGCDTYFENGYSNIANLEIYRTRSERYSKKHYIDAYHDELWNIASQIAKSVHPAWDRMGEYARALHTRNAFQVLGRNLNMPAKFLICWTEKGESTTAECTSKTGGTGTAIKIADQMNIPVFNLGNQTHRERIATWLNIKLRLTPKVKETQQLLF